MLFTPTLKRVDSFGRQTRRPPDWPFGPDSEIWVSFSSPISPRRQFQPHHVADVVTFRVLAGDAIAERQSCHDSRGETQPLRGASQPIVGAPESSLANMSVGSLELLGGEGPGGKPGKHVSLPHLDGLCTASHWCMCDVERYWHTGMRVS